MDKNYLFLVAIAVVAVILLYYFITPAATKLGITGPQQNSSSSNQGLTSIQTYQQLINFQNGLLQSTSDFVVNDTVYSHVVFYNSTSRKNVTAFDNTSTLVEVSHTVSPDINRLTEFSNLAQQFLSDLNTTMPNSPALAYLKRSNITAISTFLLNSSVFYMCSSYTPLGYFMNFSRISAPIHYYPQASNCSKISLNSTARALVLDFLGGQVPPTSNISKNISFTNEGAQTFMGQQCNLFNIQFYNITYSIDTNLCLSYSNGWPLYYNTHVKDKLYPFTYYTTTNMIQTLLSTVPPASVPSLPSNSNVSGTPSTGLSRLIYLILNHLISFGS